MTRNIRRNPFIGIPRIQPTDQPVFPDDKEDWIFEDDIWKNMVVLLGLEEDPETGLLQAYDPELGWVVANPLPAGSGQVE